MAKQPLGEVFGFPIDNRSEKARRYQASKLCPFNNKVPNCTKDKANAPLGVCSVLDSKGMVITCPVRFREDWLIAEDAAGFFFPPGASWTSLTEVKLKDRDGVSAGNIDVVLVSYDSAGKLTDFGALEVQAVYISGNVRNPFEHFMSDPDSNANMDWSKQKLYPNPDFLSSSRKRLAPQLLFKGGILHEWRKKIGVALDERFFRTLPALDEVDRAEAEIAWFVYDLIHNPSENRYALSRSRTVYTKFSESLLKITTSNPGNIESFIDVLQGKLDEKLDQSTPPTNVSLEDLL